MIICHVDLCGYRSKEGFCKRKIVNITQNGLCGQIYDQRGAIKPGWDRNIENLMMENITIVEKEAADAAQ